jgi:hypothetical protein
MELPVSVEGDDIINCGENQSGSERGCWDTDDQKSVFPIENWYGSYNITHCRSHVICNVMNKQYATHHDVKYLKTSVLTSWIECTVINLDWGDILRVKSPKRPPEGKLQPNFPLATDRTADTELSPVNRFARAVTQTTCVVIGQSVRNSERPGISFALREP